MTSPSVPVRPAADRNLLLFLTLIALAGLIPRILLGNMAFIGFDGWWHLFLATQDRWFMFFGELKSDAHPPMFYLLLRLLARFSLNPLWLRAAGIVCGSAVCIPLGLAAAKMYSSRGMALLAAAAYNLAWSTIFLDADLRAYPIALLFVALSFHKFLDWTSAPEARDAGWTMATFGLYALAGMLFEYYVVFYLGACVCVLVFRFLQEVEFREGMLASLRRHWGKWLFTFGAPALLVIGYLTIQLGVNLAQQDYLRPYNWNEGDAEGLGGYLLRNLQNEAGFFSPLDFRNDAMLAILLLVVPGLVYFLFLRKNRTRNAAAQQLPFICFLILLELLILSILQIYPFGGLFRHQSIAAPFVFLTVFLLLDRIAEALPAGFARIALLASVGLVTAANLQYGWNTYSRTPHELSENEMARFRQLFPQPGAVYFDFTNSLIYYGDRHDSRWEFLSRSMINGHRIVVYTINGPDGRGYFAIRDKRISVFNLQDAEVYQILAEALRAQGLRSAVLVMTDAKWGTQGVKGVEAALRELPRQAGLECGRHEVGETYAFAELVLR